MQTIRSRSCVAERVCFGSTITFQCPDSRFCTTTTFPPWAPQTFGAFDLYTSPGADEMMALTPKRIRTRRTLIHNASQARGKFGVGGPIIPLFITGSHPAAVHRQTQTYQGTTSYVIACEPIAAAQTLGVRAATYPTTHLITRFGYVHTVLSFDTDVVRDVLTRIYLENCSGLSAAFEIDGLRRIRWLREREGKMSEIGDRVRHHPILRSHLLVSN